MSKKQILTPFCIQTGEGFYDYEDPSRSTVTIEEIAHSLHGIRRWNGQTTPYISVAQHVCLVSDWLLENYNAEIAFYGLHHDDHEALRGDIPSPRKRYLKAHGQLFKGEEEAEDKFIYGTLLGIKYPVPHEIEEAVKEADLISLLTEKTHLKPDTVVWPKGYPQVDGLVSLTKEHLFEYLTDADWELEYLTRHTDLQGV